MVRIHLPPSRSLVRTCLTLLLARTTPGAWRDPLAANAFISTSSRAVILPILGRAPFCGRRFGFVGVKCEVPHTTCTILELFLSSVAGWTVHLGNVS